MPQTEITPYRKEAELPVEPDEVVLDRVQFADLQRCKDVLDTLEENGAWISVHKRSRGRRRWSVEIPTGEYNDVYPVVAEGDGPTLRAAVEDAMEWDEVDPWYEPVPPRSPSRFFWWMIGALIGMAASHWWF